MGYWECAQHGQGCNSYVQGIVDKWNKAGYTPKTIPKDQLQFKKCVRFVRGD